jgi:AcrR family transcriptional regulator
MLGVMDPPVRLVERKRRQARERIIQAAEELFFTRGFDEVSVSDIAERAEVGRTTFFRHFSDKQEVAFAREQQLLEIITAAAQEADFVPVQDMTEAVEQLCQLVLAMCARATADPEDYARHFRLVEQTVELRGRDALKMRQFAEKLSSVLINRGADQTVAISAAHVALGCYLTARSLGNDPRTLVDDTRAAFERVLTLSNRDADAAPHHRSATQ